MTEGRQYPSLKLIKSIWRKSVSNENTAVQFIYFTYIKFKCIIWMHYNKNIFTH